MLIGKVLRLTNHMKTFVYFNRLEKSSLSLCEADIGSYDFSFLNCEFLLCHVQRFFPPLQQAWSVCFNDEC